jgi:hypothetical protein
MDRSDAAESLPPPQTRKVVQEATKPSSIASLPAVEVKSEAPNIAPSFVTTLPACSVARKTDTAVHLKGKPQIGGGESGVVVRPKVHDPGNYVWSNSATEPDLIARGMVSYYGEPFAVVDIMRAGVAVARMMLSLSSRFFQFFRVGLVYQVDVGGQPSTRCDCIWGYEQNGRRGYDVFRYELVDVASRIPSLPKALQMMRRDRAWSLPALSRGADVLRVRCDWEDVVCIPLVVRVTRRRTSERLVKVHFYAWHRLEGRQSLELCAEGYLSWHSAIALAHCTRIGAKLALPEGGWTFGEVAPDIWKRPDGKSFGRGLSVRLPSVPPQGGARLHSITTCSLSEECGPIELDWTRGVFPVPKNKPT